MAQRGSSEERGQEMAKFRFQDMEIWQLAIQIGDVLLDIADDLEQKKLYRFADQMRGAAVSVSNNIAEGSGSASKREFAQFLNIAKRSCFEDANMVIVFHRRGLIRTSTMDDLLERLDELCRKIANFRKTLGE
jgi:four helix bundle protein